LERGGTDEYGCKRRIWRGSYALTTVASYGKEQTMKIEPFLLERWMTTHELKASYDIAESGILPSPPTTSSPSRNLKNAKPS
jgi:hypothetical protein